MLGNHRNLKANEAERNTLMALKSPYFSGFWRFFHIEKLINEKYFAKVEYFLIFCLYIKKIARYTYIAKIINKKGAIKMKQNRNRGIREKPPKGGKKGGKAPPAGRA